MIPLADIDALAVLSGARVPLRWLITDEQVAAADHEIGRRLLAHAQTARVEWCADHGWHIDSAGDRAFFTRPHGAMALDPSDSDVARLLDRRIAAQCAAQAFTWAELYISRFDHQWSIRWGAGDHSYECGVGHLIEIEPTAANIPTARAALIRALYPRKDT